jgi:thymidine phosphorylase
MSLPYRRNSPILRRRACHTPSADDRGQPLTADGLSTMRAVDVILKKRDGAALSRPEIDFFVKGATEGTWADYQVSALLMAIVWRGMMKEETSWLTESMVGSGVRLNLSDVSGAKVDKHSTGGVGDKTSLVVAPLAAACGAASPRCRVEGWSWEARSQAGRSSWAVAGRDSQRFATLDVRRFGQTSEIAPADRKPALRDVTEL